MSGVGWLCVIGLVLAFLCLFTGSVSAGAIGIVMFPLLGLFDWYEFGRPSPPTSAAAIDPDDDDGGGGGGFLHRFGRSGPTRRPGGGRGGGSKVPARALRKPPDRGGSEALPLPEE